MNVFFGKCHSVIVKYTWLPPACLSQQLFWGSAPSAPPLLVRHGRPSNGKKKINLFPLHLFKKLLICYLPMKSSPLTEGPIGRHCSCETLANPWLHSNVGPSLSRWHFIFRSYLFMMCKGGPEGRTTLKSASAGQSCAGLQIWDYRREQELRGKSEVLTCFSAASWCEGHFGKGREFRYSPCSKLSLSCLGRGRRFLSGPYRMCYWDLQAESKNNPWIPTSRGLSCSTTAWTSSPRTSRPQCASTRCQTLSTSSTRASTASCRRGPLTGSATSSAAPWWGWAPQAPPPPCCPDTPPWAASDPPSPARPCTTTETTTPTWEDSPSREPSAPWRAAVWAAGRRAAVTGEEQGSSAPTVSQHPPTQTSHPLKASVRALGIEETHLDNRKIFDADALLESIIHPFDFVWQLGANWINMSILL